MNDCDILLMVGLSFFYFEFLFKEGWVCGVQIDCDGCWLLLCYLMEVSLVGDSCCMLQVLLLLFRCKEDCCWCEYIEVGVGVWWWLLEKWVMNEVLFINLQWVFWELFL